MANGAGAEEFVLLSQVRTGLKREFAFALKAQSELAASPLGRTRSRRWQNSASANGIVESTPRKRLKSKNVKEESRSDAKEIRIQEEPENDVVQVPNEENPDTDRIGTLIGEEMRNNAAEIQAKEQTGKDAVDMPTEVEPENNAVGIPIAEEPKNDVVNLFVKEDSDIDMTEPQGEEPLNDMENFPTDWECIHDSVLVSSVNTKLIHTTMKSPSKEGTEIVTEVVIDDSSKVSNALPENPVKRYTRSASKSNVEPAEILATACDGSVASKDSNDLKVIEGDGKTTEVVCALGTPLKKKLEMKMSKKISLNKLPSTIEELLETGLLEGLPVKYFRGSKKIGTVGKGYQGKGLPGTIKDSGILCSCNFCKEKKVPTPISPYQFERHACSKNNDPLEYIYLDNGNCLREVLDACRGAPLDTLEITIQSAIGTPSTSLNMLEATTQDAIGTSPVGEDTICQNFNGSMFASCTGEMMCDSFTREPCQSTNVLAPIEEASTCQNYNGSLPTEEVKLSDSCMGKMMQGTSIFLPPKEATFCQKCKGSLPASHAGDVRLLCDACVGKTTQVAVVHSPMEDAAICQNCKVSLTASHTKNEKLLCNSCMEAANQSAVASLTIENATVCQNCKGIFPASRTRRAKVLCSSCIKATTPSSSGSLPLRKKVVCKNCNGSVPASRTGKAKLLCNSCMESEESEESPSQLTGTVVRSSKSVSNSKDPDSAPKSISSNKKSQGRITRKDLRLHKLVFEEDGLPDGTEVAYYARGKKLLVGYKKGFGIFCRCCNSEVSPSQFEAHAGWASRRKPYLHIYTSNGVSLHELSISLSKVRKFSAKDNDDLCTICADGGDLLLCDGCPRAFHRGCLSLSNLPPGDWFCKYCQNMFQKEKFVEHNANAIAAGRVLGVDSIEQISKRCIRIVKDPEVELGGCALCSGHGFSRSKFGPRTVILCDQCEKEYHVGCLKDHKMADLKELPEGKWFCCMGCSSIHSALQNLLVCGPEKVPDSHAVVIKKKHEEKGLNGDADLDVRWRLLSGRSSSPETKLLLSKAVAIFHERFDPIIDSKTERDLIPSMVYGRNIRGQELGGMYCAILTVNSLIVSAGIFRVFGQEVAELPLVATSIENQGQGYFQSLFSCIEGLLASLNVRNLVLPAADEAESIWTAKFGFKKITHEQLCAYRKNCQMMTFEGTSMLQKLVPNCQNDGESMKDG